MLRPAGGDGMPKLQQPTRLTGSGGGARASAFLCGKAVVNDPVVDMDLALRTSVETWRSLWPVKASRVKPALPCWPTGYARKLRTQPGRCSNCTPSSLHHLLVLCTTCPLPRTSSLMRLARLFGAFPPLLRLDLLAFEYNTSAMHCSLVVVTASFNT